MCDVVKYEEQFVRSLRTFLKIEKLRRFFCLKYLSEARQGVLGQM
jgi:hypothetical protein